MYTADLTIWNKHAVLKMAAIFQYDRHIPCI